MSSVTFHPSRLHGSVAVPPAKSEAHRILLLSAIGRGECLLHGFVPPLCDDTQAMLAGITALGATVHHEGDKLRIVPAPPPAPTAPPITVHVGACAAALRMLIPAFLVRGQAVRFTMEPALFARPLNAFEPLIAQIGATMRRTPATPTAPAMVELSGVLHAGCYEIDGALSSQYASGLLIALSHATNKLGQAAPSTLMVKPPIVSRPYLDMTIKLMERFHVPCAENEEGVFVLPPATTSSPSDERISGDWSQAAVLLCANAMGSGIMLDGLCCEKGDCLQGDAHVLDVLSAMGMRLYRTHGELYAVSPSRAELMPVTVDCSDIPDIAPILALTLTQAHGTSTLSGVSRLRVKECDRLCATLHLLRELGAKPQVSADGDTLTVCGPVQLSGGFTADAQNDHRMVMLLAVAALIASKPITVSGVESLNKSWPSFLSDYQKLGGKLS
ncbi:MAG: hypothetical protein RSB06_03660 [Clostridia bacterium]